MPASTSQRWMRVVRAALPRRLAILVLLILVVQAVLIAMVVRSDDQTRPRHVPITIAASSPLVADSFAERANALDGEPFDASVADDEAGARQAVLDGTTIAAVLVDLRGTQDTMVVNDATDPELVDAVEDLAQVAVQANGRSLTTERVHPDGALLGSTGATYTAILLASVLAFALVVGISVVRGPIARTFSLGVLRVVGIGVAAVLVGAALAAATGLLSGPDPLLVVGVVALAFVVAGTITAAFEGLAGWSGLALTVGVFAVLGTPLLSRTHPDLLPAPWPEVAPWTPSGASLDALWTITAYGGHGLVWPVLLSAVWWVLAVIGLVVARGLRRDLGVAVTDVGELVEAPAHHRRALLVWRVRVLLVVVPAAALLLAAVGLLDEGSVAAPPRMPSLAAETDCVATGDVDSVSALNQMTKKLRSEPGFQGGDVGADAGLQGGQRIWMFGDTLRDKSFNGQQFVRNSMLLESKECLSVVYPDSRGAIVPDRGDGVGYWPMSVTQQSYPGYDLVYVGMQRVQSTGDTAFSFESLGPAMAVFLVAEGDTPQLIDTVDLGPDSADKSRPMWGAAAAVSRGWVYLYGTSNPDDGSAYGFAVRVARVRPDNILDQAMWSYWDGEKWSGDPNVAIELIPAVGGVSQTFSVFAQGDRWYALSKQDEFLGTDLDVWSAANPWGPFDDPVTVGQLPSDATNGELRYMPLAHPDLLPEEGSVTVSYSRNSTDVDKVIDDPLLYRPRFLTVDLP